MRFARILTPLLIALTAAGCALQSRLPRGAVYIPSDAAFVLSLDLPAIAATELYKELERQGGAVGLNRLNFFKFASMVGLDPLKDVRSLTFLGRTQEGAGPQIDELSAVVSGSFDGGKARQFLKESGIPFETHVGLDIYQVVIVEDRCRLCIAVLDDTTAAFGDGETLRAMAEGRRDAAMTLSADPTARRLLSRIDNRAAIWGLVRGKNFAEPFAKMLSDMAGGNPTAEAIGTVRDVSFFVAAERVITVAVDAVVKSAEDALLVADILEGAGAVGKLALKQAKPEASHLLATFKVQVDGELLRASTSFPEASLVELAQAFGRDVMGAGLFGVPFTGVDGFGHDPLPAEPVEPQSSPSQ